MNLPAAFVVDASVSAAWFLPDETTPFSEALLMATSRADVWVPALWQLEICNLLRMAQRRQRIAAAVRREMIGAAATLRLKVDRTPLSLTELDAIADSQDLTAYDAMYFELAIRKRLPLATMDEALIRAVGRAGGTIVTLD